MRHLKALVLRVVGGLSGLCAHEDIALLPQRRMILRLAGGRSTQSSLDPNIKEKP